MSLKLAWRAARCAFFLAAASLFAAGAAHAQGDWKTSTPQAQGIDAERLGRMQEYLRSQPRIRSVAVARNGVLAYEYYREGLKPDDLHEVASVTKSVLSALVGIAVGQGKLAPTQTLGDLLPEPASRAADTRVRAIELRQLLALSGGFEADPPTFNPATLAGAESDAVDKALQRTLALGPGEGFRYNNHDGQLVSAALARAVGMNAARYAEQTLFTDLGIQKYQWPQDRAGVNIGASTLRLTTRDMAKLGELFLRQGRWSGRQVVPADWVAASLAKQADGGPPLRRPYGYNWWLGVMNAGEPRPVFMAAGWGGQYIYVVPSLQLVVAATSEMDGEDSTTSKMIREQLLPAVQR